MLRYLTFQVGWRVASLRIDEKENHLQESRHLRQIVPCQAHVSFHAVWYADVGDSFTVADQQPQRAKRHRRPRIQGACSDGKVSWHWKQLMRHRWFCLTLRASGWQLCVPSSWCTRLVRAAGPQMEDSAGAMRNSPVHQMYLHACHTHTSSTPQLRSGKALQTLTPCLNPLITLAWPLASPHSVWAFSAFSPACLPSSRLSRPRE